ncbi:DUF4058 family protein [Sphaerospermopsis torques-reginae]|jgi:hypothetical protein|uniref:DUF4058 family protein n=1 Tax=Sphaerospermopsis torques-reginae ITEP-024 TaxID=984208 RepID=A0ABX8X0K0_9CYAN|nr:DUF4058 family protein [Sphaerospermopsis torques-reginae]QYX32235.1 DUF4058 family protein [Sphaerospermopsis torques-reginae ITEP-024]
MTSPFPGMNPYLENPDLWSEVHHRLITAIAIAISPPLRPKYRVAIEKRTYRTDSEDSLLVGIPDVTILSVKQKTQKSDNYTATATLSTETANKSVDVTLPLPLEIKEGYLEIREVSTGKVVTVIEVLSPTNKRTKEGRKSYLEKRENILQGDTNLVEIDLIRAGEKMPMITHIADTDYRILIVRSYRLPSAQLFAFSVRETIPNFTIPLQKGEQEIEVNLQDLLLEIYEQAGFDLTLDYNIPPVPDLSVEAQEWMDKLLREQGRRGES